MGNKHSSAAQLHDDARLAASRFDEEELIVLQRTWADLAERSDPQKGINKETFLQYMPLNGLLGDRLFDTFNTSGNGFISMDEFVTGLAQMGRGSMDAKIRFLFNMCDVDHSETIPKDQLTTLLNQIPTDVLHTHDWHAGSSSTAHHASHHSSSNDLQRHGGDTQSDSGESNTTTNSDPRGGDSKGGPEPESDDYEEVDNYTNHDIIEKAFNECDVRHEGRLDFEEFRMWVERTPQIIAYIEQNMAFAGMVKNPHGEKHHHKKETLPLMQRRLSSMRRNQASFDSIASASQNDLLHGYSPALASNSTSTSTKIGSFVRHLGRKLSLSSTTAAQDAHKTSSLSRENSVSSTPVTTPRQTHKHSHSHASDAAVDHSRSFSEGSRGHGPNAIGASADADESLPRSRINSIADEVEAGDDQAQVRGLLMRAYDVCRVPAIKSQIASVLDSLDVINFDREDSMCPHEVAPLEGYLWKRGNTLHLWSKRYYVISGNCMYYYASKEDVRVKGVVFLEGSHIEKIDSKEEKDLEIQGYFGFEISHMNMCTGEHHRHDKRVLYCRSEAERDEWVHALQREAHVVPIQDDYVFGRELGRGRFSVVQECVHKTTGVHSAVKIIDKSTVSQDEKALLRTEIAVLKLVKHPNIIKMLGLYESKEHIYIVMEMLDGGELFERIVGRPRFSEFEASKLLRPLLESVAYLHDLGIVHRDLKPENILCGAELEDLKIADFGLSKMVLPKEKMDAACGTLSYVAPEVLTAQGYGKEADLWSVGVILFLLLCGKLPFDGADTNEIIRSTIQADLKVNPAVWSKLSEDAKNLLTSLLNKSPKERISARAALRHPFLTTLNPRDRRVSLADKHPPPPTGASSSTPPPAEEKQADKTASPGPALETVPEGAESTKIAPASASASAPSPASAPAPTTA